MNSFSGHRPLVTAIIATYNRAHVVCESIESILHQSYPNIELIVIDDGSTDQTQEILSAYGDRIRVVYQKNSGPAAAWNKGIKESKGEIIAFLGSDDIWLPTFVERHVSVLRQAGRDVPCSLANSLLSFANGFGTTSFQNTNLRPAFGEGIWLNPAEVFLTRFVLFGQSVAIRRSALDEVGWFDESLWYLEDLDLAVKLGVGKSWGFIREPLVVWRQSTTDSLSQKGMNKRRLELTENRRKIYSSLIPKVESLKNATRLQRVLKRELAQVKLELKAEKYGVSDNFMAGLLAKSIRFIRKCQGYLYKKTSAYPLMEVVQFGQPSAKEIESSLGVVAPRNA